MGSGKGASKRVKTVIFEKNDKTFVETRFTNKEIELLDQLITQGNYVSREEAVLGMTLGQLQKIKQGKVPTPDADKSFSARLKNFTTSPNLKNTTIIQLEDLDEDNYDDIKLYQEITGCRTILAAPRHAVVETLKDAGLLDKSVNSPRGFEASNAN